MLHDFPIWWDLLILALPRLVAESVNLGLLRYLILAYGTLHIKMMLWFHWPVLCCKDLYTQFSHYCLKYWLQIYKSSILLFSSVKFMPGICNDCICFAVDNKIPVNMNKRGIRLQSNANTRKVKKIWTPRKLAVSILKFEHFSFTLE